MNALELLNEKHIRLSGLRVKILDYLLTQRTHPTIDEIYGELIKDNPTLSKTTVYNTVKVLEENGLAKAVTIDGDRVHYDGDVSYHGHFLCKTCNKIYDFDTSDVPVKLPEGFTAETADVYCTGNCSNCSKNK